MNDTDAEPSDAAGAEERAPSAPDRPAETPPGRLASLARWLAWGLAVYAAVASGLVVLSLRRGRLLDALIIVVSLLFTTPLILGYRRQLLERRRRIVASRPTADDASASGEAGP